MIADSVFEMSVIVMDVRPKPGLKRLVEERDEQGVCLLCAKEAWKRGLCTTHYGRWRAARGEQPKHKQAAFDAQQIRDGKLLPDRQGQKLDVVNEYRS
jgi:hypothetical protein